MQNLIVAGLNGVWHLNSSERDSSQCKVAAYMPHDLTNLCCTGGLYSGGEGVVGTYNSRRW